MRDARWKIPVMTCCGLVAAACGGGGDSAAPPALVPPVVVTPVVKTTGIAGTVSPPATPAAALPNLAGPTDMLIAPGAGTIAFASIVQQMDFMLDVSDATAVRVASASTYAVHHDGFLSVGFGTAYAADATLGRWTSFDPGSPPSVPTSLSSQPRPVIFDSIDASGPMPSASYASGIGLSFYTLGYVLPISATLNPAGYTYQTFGELNSVDTTAGGPFSVSRPASEWSFVDAWFSAGIPTDPVTIPVAGAAVYSGVVAGTAVNAATRDAATMYATVNASVNFATRTVTLATSNSRSLSANAAAAALPSADASLNMSGTLNYAAANNTFTGMVTSGGGLTGNATCRFYGPGISTATGSKVIGSPTEIGCTFAANNTITGILQGALGAN